MRKLPRRKAVARASLLGGSFLLIAVWAAVAEPSPLSWPAILIGLVVGGALMQLLIRTGLAVPGYISTQNGRQVGLGAAIGVGATTLLASAGSVLYPAVLAVAPVAFAALIAGFFLILIPNLARREPGG